jgi:hypothetical protein
MLLRAATMNKCSTMASCICKLSYLHLVQCLATHKAVTSTGRAAGAPCASRSSTELHLPPPAAALAACSAFFASFSCSA